MIICLRGNLGEGYSAVGPFLDWESATDYLERCDGELFEVIPPESESETDNGEIETEEDGGETDAGIE